MTDGAPRDRREQERPPPPPGPPPGWASPGPGQGWQQRPWEQPPQPWGQQPRGGRQGGPEPQAPLAANLASGLTYLLALVTILISSQVEFSIRMVLAVVPLIVGFLLLLTDRRFEVRFNALQGLLLWALLVALEVGRHALFWVFAVVCFFTQLLLIMALLALLAAAFQGRHLKLPAIGDFAEQQAGGPGSSPDTGPGRRSGPPSGWGSPR